MQRTVSDILKWNQPEVYRLLCSRYPSIKRGKLIDLKVTASDQEQPIAGRLAQAI